MKKNRREYCILSKYSKMLNKLHFLLVSIFFLVKLSHRGIHDNFPLLKTVSSCLAETTGWRGDLFWLLCGIQYYLTSKHLLERKKSQKNKRHHTSYWTDFEKKRLNQAYKGEEYGTIIKERVTKYKMSKVSVYSHAYNSSSFICCCFILPAAFFFRR